MKVTIILRIWHFDAFSFRLAVRNRCKKALIRCICCSGVLENTIMSSRYTRHVSKFRPDNTMSISLWKVPGELDKPNGMTRHRNVPLLVMNAVLSASSGSWPLDGTRCVGLVY